MKKEREGEKKEVQKKDKKVSVAFFLNVSVNAGSAFTIICFSVSI